MSYIIKTRLDGDETYYFYKFCRKVYQDQKTPAFREDIESAYVFDTKERAYRMMSIIAGLYPALNMEIEEVTEPVKTLRGPDGYVPLENTIDAMLSADFRHRLWAEYEQLNTRRHKLKELRKKMSEHAEAVELLAIDAQITHMHSYMIDLLDRCRLNDIDLTEVEKELT